ncbi:Lrp/AsnC family transcriptional regulator [Archangium violaceum]|nr:Lrp/AsnC family transcriptional regulator [Archangium violaceum]
MRAKVAKVSRRIEGRNPGRTALRRAETKVAEPVRLRNESGLDATDWRLLRELEHDGRASLAELGRRVGLSAPAVSERMRRLEEAGVITGYRVQIHLPSVGLPVLAFIRLTTTPSRRVEEVLEVLDAMPEVHECHRVTGNECFVLKVALPDMAHLETVIDRLRPYGQTVTSVVLSTPVPYRMVSRR